jgi:SpoVK/Ycf46/Vps4 family AAA+-type ATPase
MAQPSSTATPTMRYRGEEFNRVVGQLKQSAHGASTMFAFVGMPKPAMESAARELAASMGRSLHRVDLSQVVSKYVGETEKNISQLFRSADRSGTILLSNRRHRCSRSVCRSGDRLPVGPFGDV